MVQKKGERVIPTNILQIIFIILAGSAMIAHALRMITQGIFFPNSYYPAPLPTELDFWFDWMILLVFGISVSIIGFRQWSQIKGNSFRHRWNSRFYKKKSL